MMRIFNIIRYPLYLKKIYWTIAAKIILKCKGANCEWPLECHGLPIIDLVKDSQLILGRGLSLCSDSKYTSLGVSHPVILKTLLPGAQIKIGDESGLSGTTVCAAISVIIGSRCLIGADVMIVDTDFHPIMMKDRRYKGPADSLSAPVVIQDDVFIGARSIILKGVTVGFGSVIGAGSVVTSDVRPNTVVAGNPAKWIKNI